MELTIITLMNSSILVLPLFFYLKSASKNVITTFWSVTLTIIRLGENSNEVRMRTDRNVVITFFQADFR